MIRNIDKKYDFKSYILTYHENFQIIQLINELFYTISDKLLIILFTRINYYLNYSYNYHTSVRCPFVTFTHEITSVL